VLASIFARLGGYETTESFVDGLVPAVWVGAALVAVGAVAAFTIPSRRREPASRPEPAFEEA
ncbi:MAG TPA: hypothetical protein VFR32_11030, partial [Gaiellaceae bacterium]|nr:hypothetical protein [Gaiellaceae bacterium]